ncbi:uncharacterized protein LOC122264738 [Penaeus japonicus]|uniref:uncharacterized protein LOC122264738 n=1 Tax=Penaeus japonicus TaxID=27405 RepID=UPI001C70B726|nr:uncharacterized protein LOC122264738 [Penaeus japonicus]
MSRKGPACIYKSWIRSSFTTQPLHFPSLEAFQDCRMVNGKLHLAAAAAAAALVLMQLSVSLAAPSPWDGPAVRAVGLVSHPQPVHVVRVSAAPVRTVGVVARPVEYVAVGGFDDDSDDDFDGDDRGGYGIFATHRRVW